MKPYHSDGSGALYVGDCAEVLADLGAYVDLIVTSPPYDNLRTYGGHGFDFERVADACVAALKPGGVLVWVVADATIDGSETGSSFRQALGFMERGLKLHDTMIWQKSSPGNWTPRRYAQDWEYMFVLANGKPQTCNMLKDKPNNYAGQSRHRISRKGRTTYGRKTVKERFVVIADYGLRSGVWYVPTVSIPGGLEHLHPAIFPTALARDHIRTWSNPGDLVLDPMAGSGTTLRAAKDLGRHWLGVEIHQPYADLITHRMAQEVMPLATEEEPDNGEHDAKQASFEDRADLPLG